MREGCSDAGQGARPQHRDAGADGDDGDDGEMWLWREWGSRQLYCHNLHTQHSQALLPTFNLNFAGNYFKFIFNFSVRFLHKNCKKFKVHAERIVLMQFYHILTFANYHFPVQALYSVSSGRNVASFSQSGSSSCPTANRSGRLLKACEHKSCK